MWTLLALGGAGLLLVVMYLGARAQRATHPDRTAQLIGKAMTPLEILACSKEPTTGQVMISLLSHDVLVVLLPPVGFSPKSSMCVFQDDEGTFVLVTPNYNVLAALQPADWKGQPGFTAQLNPDLDGKLKYVGRMPGEQLLLECPPGLAIRLLLRTEDLTGIREVTIDAETIAEVQALKREMSSASDGSP
ncbi:hypothetical protein [Achromobacter spanius]|uniref:Uncharacterized protein n=1 Tax=Achromobacter spanius TaxID=217203 RepID=A0A2S0ICZ3_9BURK|nr:hypothetical protein [Achromobacter spanius]AVJ29909.1 hypothetical protein CLM73_23965 [Achromobacter spanius]